MKNVVLIGMMGCGKTTVGILLSQTLELELVDTDALIIAREKRSIAEIFASDGEDYFRSLELNICEELAPRQNLLIACGGGLPLNTNCMRHLQHNSLVFWLNRDPEKIYSTLDVSERPLAQQGRAAFLQRCAQRAPIYRNAANFIVPDTNNPQEAANIITAILKREGILS